MKRVLLALMVALAAAGPARAAIVFSESFPYPDGPVVGATGSPWANNSGNAGTALVVSNRLELSNAAARGEDIVAGLGRTFEAAGPEAALYARFTAVFRNLPSRNGSYFSHFTGTSLSTHRCRVWASTTNAAAGAFRLGIANTSGGDALSGQATNDLELNTLHTVVIRYELASGLSTLWIDPAAESDIGVTATDPVSVVDLAHYSFRQASGIGVSQVDDLKVGTTFAEVTGSNSPPTISAIPDQRTAAGMAVGPIPFTVGDIETPADALEATGGSSAPTLLPEANLEFGGSGTSRSLTLRPVAGQQGVAIVSVVVRDADDSRTTNHFRLIVGAPSISDIANQCTPSNTVAGPIAFVIGDTETPASGLAVTASSSNPGLVRDDQIQITGTHEHRALTITPVPNQTGLATIVVTVSDGLQSASDAFELTVYPLLGLLREDDFNRPDGPVVDFSGAWLSYGGMGGTNLQQMQITGNRLQVTESQSEDIFTELPPSQFEPPVYRTNSGTLLYASMKIRVAQLPTAGGDYFAHFRDGGYGYRAKLFVSLANAAPGCFRVGVANVANSLPAASQVPVDLPPDATQFLVLRYNVGTAESRLWLNPTTESSPGVSAADSAPPVDIIYFAFRQDAGIGTVLVDDLKIGTAFTDVAPVALRVTVAGNTVQVWWPKAYAGYVLEGNASLDPAGWSAAGTPTERDNQYVVEFPGVTGRRFFRLAKTTP